LPLYEVPVVELSGATTDNVRPNASYVYVVRSQVTLEDHGETILEPDEREHWMEQVRRFVNG
jgi:hypothetical protein